MSSSPPPLVSSLASCEFRPSSSSPASHGSASAARVSHLLHQASARVQTTSRRIGDDMRPQDMRIGAHDDGKPTYSTRAQDLRGFAGPQNLRKEGSSGEEESASDDLSIAPSSSSASAQEQSPGASAAVLNPLAREFIPGAALSPPTNEGFAARVEPAELATAVEPSFLDNPSPSQDGSERVSGVILEGINNEGLEPFQRNGTRRAGGLSTALKRGGRTGQSRTWGVSRGSQGGTDSTAGQPSGGQGKRGQFTNANHLLNFQYDPIVRPPSAPRIPFSRKSHKVQPFNKELFLQANFRFLVSDFGDYMLNSLDPDRMLQWEDIAAVNVSAPIPIQCPICLESPPVCPQITSCGHIFCFPCILRYLVLGDGEQRNEHFKKCPLCFAMTSSKALRTVFVDTVQNYQVGDTLELTLLNRAKGSIIPFEKSEGVTGSLPFSKDGQFHSFSKFTLTSDADQTTSKAITELSGWAERAQNEGGEDMDLIPFVLLAIDQLQQRKTAWTDHRASEFLSSSPPVRQRIMAQTKEGSSNSLSQGLKLSTSENEGIEGTRRAHQGKQRGEMVDVASETEAAMADLKGKAGWVYENAFSDDEELGPAKTRLNKSKDIAIESAPDVTPVGAPSSWEENVHEKTNGLERVEGISDLSKDTRQVTKKEDEDDECYAFFQCADGQPLIMHPLNMKCLLQHYGSYEKLPSRLQVKILEMEGQIQTEALRKRYRYLSHLPLTTNFWFCEVDLRGILPGSAFASVIDELRYRETRRRRRQKQEQAERLREERMSAVQSRGSLPSDFIPILDDSHEEKLPLSSGSDESGLDPVLSSPGPADQRKLFSQVTRLGFASAHDAPGLTPAKTLEPSVLSHEKASSLPGSSGNLSPMSFADIIQAQPLKTAATATNGSAGPSQSSSKRNKKASKILLSTAGGRRY
eukprot:c22636_g1_i1 orf=105-2864(+)